MTETEARDLAVRLTASWPNYPGVDISTWIDELRPLDAGTAGTAIVRLRRELERPPSIHRFFLAYRALDTDSRREGSGCDACSGSGWVPAPDRVHGTGDDARHIGQARPCNCADGHVAAKSRTWTERRRPEQPTLERPAELF